MKSTQETFCFPLEENLDIGRSSGDVEIELTVKVIDKRDVLSPGYLAVLPYNAACSLCSVHFKADINKIKRSNFKSIESEGNNENINRVF
ncbi:MAG: hypothetical protein ACTSVB_11400 [Candidatus Heimdallarchaeaceae archaeon]